MLNNAVVHEQPNLDQIMIEADGNVNMISRSAYEAGGTFWKDFGVHKACRGDCTKPAHSVFKSPTSCVWVCKSKYFQRGRQCELKLTTCGIGETLNTKQNRCDTCDTTGKPSNAAFTTANTCDWACNKGYFRRGQQCEREITKCDGIGEIVNKEQNRCDPCSNLPEHAEFTTANTCDWACSKGYFQRGDTCEDILKTCGVGQTLNGEQNRCDACDTTKKPGNAEFTTANTCDWACNKGYFQRGQNCELKLDTCDIGQTLNGEQNRCDPCSNLPEDAEFTTVNTCDWACNKGYFQRGDTCEPKLDTCGIGQTLNGEQNRCDACDTTEKPGNAKFTTANTCDWACNKGYFQRGQNCELKLDTCGIGQMLIEEQNRCDPCSNLPEDAEFTTVNTCDWACNKGYFQRGDTCEPKLDTCGIGQTLNGEQNRCDACDTTEKPNNAEFTTANTCDWVCNKGYFQRGDTCEPKITECNTIGQIVNEEQNRCDACDTTEKPSNAEFTTANACDWACKGALSNRMRITYRQ